MTVSPESSTTTAKILTADVNGKSVPLHLRTVRRFVYLRADVVRPISATARRQATRLSKTTVPQFPGNPFPLKPREHRDGKRNFHADGRPALLRRVMPGTVASHPSSSQCCHAQQLFQRDHNLDCRNVLSATSQVDLGVELDASIALRAAVIQPPVPYRFFREPLTVGEYQRPKHGRLVSLPDESGTTTYFRRHCLSASTRSPRSTTETGTMPPQLPHVYD